MSEGSSLAADPPFSSVLSLSWYHCVHSKWVEVQGCSWKWLPLGLELVESFLGISRLGIGGKHFPGTFYAVVRRDQQPGCPCSPWECMRTGGSRWLWLSDLISRSHKWPECVPGKALLFHCYHGNFSHTEMSCWEVVLVDASWLGWRPLLGDICRTSAGCAAAGICLEFYLHPAFGVFSN